MNARPTLEELLYAFVDLSPEQRQQKLASDEVPAELRAQLAELLEHLDADDAEPAQLDSAAGLRDNVPVESPTRLDWLPKQIGPYRVLDAIGHGGMGSVYRVEHQRLKKRFALKVLPTGAALSPSLVQRFQREMEIVGRLDHPNVVRASDAGDVRGCPYLVMDIVDGLALDSLLAANGPLAAADACEIIRQAALGLQHAHQLQLIHRDIKPGNLMLTWDAQVKVVDFGLALWQDAQAAAMTGTHQIMGTVDYMSPEQATGSHQVDASTDVYALGATAYALLTGASPLASQSSGTVSAKLLALTSGQTPTLDSNENFAPELGQLISAMLSHDTAQRPSAADVAGRLQPFAVGCDLPRLLQTVRDCQGSPPLRNVEESTHHAPTPSTAIDRTEPTKAPASRRGSGWRWATGVGAGVLLTVVALAVMPPSWYEENSGRATGNDLGTASLQHGTTGWQPSQLGRPATRSVAAWPYIYCVSPLPLDKLAPVVREMFALCNRQQLSLADDAVTLVYLDGATQDQNWRTTNATTEIRIRLLQAPSSDELAALQPQAKHAGLPALGVRRSAPGAEVYLAKPAGLPFEETEQLWESLYTYAAEQHTTGSYAAPMERIPASLWAEDQGYDAAATECIVPLD